MYSGSTILLKIYPALSAAMGGQDRVDGSRCIWMYSRLCLNPYLSVDGPGYGVLGSMYFKSDIRKITKKNSKKSEKNIDYVFVVNEIELSARKG
jgi:hypothetical protein